MDRITRLSKGGIGMMRSKDVLPTHSAESLSEEGYYFHDSITSVKDVDYESRRILTALNLAVIFEDCVDTFTSLSNSVGAPQLEIRTTKSIVEDELFNRPRYHGKLRPMFPRNSITSQKTEFMSAALDEPIEEYVRLSQRTDTDKAEKPEASIKGFRSQSVYSQPSSYILRESRQSQQSQTKSEVGSLRMISSSPAIGYSSDMRPTLSNCFIVEQEEFYERGEEKHTEPVEPEGESTMGSISDFDWMLSQHYMQKVFKRAWQGNKPTPVRPFEEMLKGVGLKKNNPMHKLQTDMAYIKYMMAGIFTELVQKGTFESLENYLEREKEEMMKLSRAKSRLAEQRKYIRKLKAHINETKASKKSELQLLKMLEHQIEDDGQEIRIRTTVEVLYTTKFVEARCQQSLKLSDQSPKEKLKEMVDINTWMDLEDSAHSAMVEFLKKKIDELVTLNEYWMDKYETDKERLMADLEDLKDERAAMKAHKQELEAKIALWLPIIVDHRRYMHLQRTRKQLLDLATRCATKIAARWRGYMVRAGLGRFGKITK